MTAKINTKIEQMSPKFFRYPQCDITFCLPPLGQHPTFRTLLAHINCIVLTNPDQIKDAYRNLGFSFSFSYLA